MLLSVFCLVILKQSRYSVSHGALFDYSMTIKKRNLIFTDIWEKTFEVSQDVSSGSVCVWGCLWSVCLFVHKNHSKPHLVSAMVWYAYNENLNQSEPKMKAHFENDPILTLRKTRSHSLRSFQKRLQ